MMRFTGRRIEAWKRYTPKGNQPSQVNLQKINAPSEDIALSQLTHEEELILCDLPYSPKDELLVLSLLKKHAFNIAYKLKEGGQDVAPDQWEAAAYLKRAHELKALLKEKEKEEKEHKNEMTNLSSLRWTKSFRDLKRWFDEARMRFNDGNRLYMITYGKPLLPAGYNYASAISNAVDLTADWGVSLYSAAHPKNGEKKFSYFRRLYNRLKKGGRPYRMTSSSSIIGLNIVGFFCSKALLPTLGILGLATNLVVVISEMVFNLKHHNDVLGKIKKKQKETEEALIDIYGQFRDTQKQIEYNEWLLKKYSPDAPNAEDVLKTRLETLGWNCPPGLSLQTGYKIANNYLLKYSTKLFAQAEEKIGELKSWTTLENKMKIKIKQAKKQHAVSIFLNCLMLGAMIGFVLINPVAAAWTLFGLGIAILAKKLWSTDLLKRCRGLHPGKEKGTLAHQEEPEEEKQGLAPSPTPSPTYEAPFISPIPFSHRSPSSTTSVSLTTPRTLVFAISEGDESKEPLISSPKLPVPIQLERTNEQRKLALVASKLNEGEKKHTVSPHNLFSRPLTPTLRRSRSADFRCAR